MNVLVLMSIRSGSALELRSQHMLCQDRHGFVKYRQTIIRPFKKTNHTSISKRGFHRKR